MLHTIFSTFTFKIVKPGLSQIDLCSLTVCLDFSFKEKLTIHSLLNDLTAHSVA